MTNILRVFGILIFLSGNLGFCNNYKNFPSQCYKIEGIPGPEDFVWLEKEKLFLISSHNRRDFKQLGEIYSYNPKTNQIRIIPRKNEPSNLSFRPHGIDFFQNRLYVIVHGEELNSRWHAVAIYQWREGTLIFETLFQNPYIISPNDLKVFSENEFFITNDMKERGSLWEYITTLWFGSPKGSIVYCNFSKNQCEYVATGLGFPNGIEIQNNQLYVSVTLENAIYEYTITPDKHLQNPHLFASIKGGDNLILYNQKLYVTSHPSIWRFLRHSQNSENHSPSIGYEIDLSNRKVKKIFEDDGSRFSAASVIQKINSKIYIGQVFDPFLFQCEEIK